MSRCGAFAANIVVAIDFCCGDRALGIVRAVEGVSPAARNEKAGFGTNQEV